MSEAGDERSSSSDSYDSGPSEDGFPDPAGGDEFSAADGEYEDVAGRTTSNGKPGGRSPDGPLDWVRWLRTTDNENVVFVREVFVSVAAVAVIGLVLFAISGVWPPMVAIESGSMEPHMNKGDLVFIMDENRLAPDDAYGDTGVVPAHAGQETGYATFGGYGDVIIFQPNGLDSTPIIHRAIFWVEQGENWYDRADSGAIPARYESCEELPNCPAPNSGFVTKGDNNEYYDQIGSAPLSDPVKPAWIIGTAEVRLPYLGWVRLQWSAFSQGQLVASPDDPVVQSLAGDDATSQSPTASNRSVAAHRLAS